MGRIKFWLVCRRDKLLLRASSQGGALQCGCQPLNNTLFLGCNWINPTMLVYLYHWSKIRIGGNLSVCVCVCDLGPGPVCIPGSLASDLELFATGHDVCMCLLSLR